MHWQNTWCYPSHPAACVCNSTIEYRLWKYKDSVILINFFCGGTAQRWPGLPLSWGFSIISQWHTTVGRTHLDEWLARRWDLYRTRHNNHKKQTSMHFIPACFCIMVVPHFVFCFSLQHTTQTSVPLARFEPATPASDRPQALALDRSATETTPDVY